MPDNDYKIEKELIPRINNIENIKILELGVQKGKSTIKFLDLCNRSKGKLFSVDIDDCSKISKDPNWKFIHSRDDEFEKIKSLIPNKINVLFIDTIHEANHVESLIYGYFNILEENGFIFIDDISHLPYLKKTKRNNFYCEINNSETFKRILEIYKANEDNIDLNFSFISSGLAIIKKKTNNNLNKPHKIETREFSLKNFIRKLFKKINL